MDRDGRLTHHENAKGQRCSAIGTLATNTFEPAPIQKKPRRKEKQPLPRPVPEFWLSEDRKGVPLPVPKMEKPKRRPRVEYWPKPRPKHEAPVLPQWQAKGFESPESYEAWIAKLVGKPEKLVIPRIRIFNGGAPGLGRRR